MMVRSHDKLQSETGYIDARPHPLDRRNLLQRTAGPYIRVKGRRTHREHNESACGAKADIATRSADFAFGPRTDSCTAAIYSITSSARAMSVPGMSRPIALAILR